MSLDHANFIRKQIESRGLIPVGYVLVGSRGCGLGVPKSDYDYIGIHLQQTEDLLEHPDYRRYCSSVTFRYDEEFKEIDQSSKSHISVVSYELWRFQELLEKGILEAIEISHIIPTITTPLFSEIQDEAKLIHIKKTGYSAIGLYQNDYLPNHRNRKKVVIAYYKLIQTIQLLKLDIFERDAAKLLAWYDSTIHPIPEGIQILYRYKDNIDRKEPLEDNEDVAVKIELKQILECLQNTMETSTLPLSSPWQRTKRLLDIIRDTRISLITGKKTE